MDVAKGVFAVKKSGDISKYFDTPSDYIGDAMKSR